MAWDFCNALYFYCFFFFNMDHKCAQKLNFAFIELCLQKKSTNQAHAVCHNDISGPSTKTKPLKPFPQFIQRQSRTVTWRITHWMWSTPPPFTLVNLVFLRFGWPGLGPLMRFGQLWSATTLTQLQSGHVSVFEQRCPFCAWKCSYYSVNDMLYKSMFENNDIEFF